MKAILINPHLATVTEVDYDGNYKSIYKLIKADTFDFVRLTSDGEGLYVDDNGLFAGDQSYFIIQTPDMEEPMQLAGPALLLGNDDEGESIATKFSTDDVWKMVIEWKKFMQIPTHAGPETKQ